MTNCSLTLVLFLAFSWISASVCQFHTVVVHPGEEVTLRCSNFSSFFSRVLWFKLASGPNVSSISSMLTFGSNVLLHDGFEQGKFSMTSNSSNIFLNIKALHANNSGLYICGMNNKGVPGVFTATHLQVEVVPLDLLTESVCLLNWILGGVIVFLAMVIIGLIVKIRTLFPAQTDVKNIQPQENSDSSTPVDFVPKAKSGRRRTAGGDTESNVLYAATKLTIK